MRRVSIRTWHDPCASRQARDCPGSGAWQKPAAATYIKSSAPLRLHSLDLPDIIPGFAAHAGTFPQDRARAGRGAVMI